jgi:hypothetical protein
MVSERNSAASQPFQKIVGVEKIVGVLVGIFVFVNALVWLAEGFKVGVTGSRVDVVFVMPANLVPNTSTVFMAAVLDAIRESVEPGAAGWHAEPSSTSINNDVVRVILI